MTDNGVTQMQMLLFLTPKQFTLCFDAILWETEKKKKRKNKPSMYVMHVGDKERGSLFQEQHQGKTW